MLEKIKQFFAGVASVTIVLYAIGFIAEYSHAKMLGSAMVDPLREYYLISGGTFFLSTFFSLYRTLIAHWYYYIIFFCAVGAFTWFDRFEQKKNRFSLQVTYTVLVFVIVLVYLFTVIPVFITPFGFDDFLLRNFEPITQGGFFAGIERDLRTWILNENPDNILKLDAFYVLLIFSTVLSAVITYALVRRWKMSAAVLKETGKKGKLFKDIPRRALPVLMVLMGIISIIQIIIIPSDFGVLIKLNKFPEVKVAMAEGVELMPDRDPEMESKLWLLRENSDEILLHAIYVEKGKSKRVFKILVVKKGDVKTLEILKKSFILEIK